MMLTYLRRSALVPLLSRRTTSSLWDGWHRRWISSRVISSRTLMSWSRRSNHSSTTFTSSSSSLIPLDGNNTNSSGVDSFVVIPSCDQDKFSVVRVSNYCARVGPKGSTFDTLATVRRVAVACGGSDDDANSATPQERHETTLRLPLPLDFRLRYELSDSDTALYAMGVGASVRESHMLCAMHAERLLGSLGIALFSLKSSQRKYIENTVKETFVVASEYQSPHRVELPPPLFGDSVVAMRNKAPERGAASVRRPRACNFGRLEDEIVRRMTLCSTPPFVFPTNPITLAALSTLDRSSVSRVRSFLRRVLNVRLKDFLVAHRVPQLERHRMSSLVDAAHGVDFRYRVSMPSLWSDTSVKKRCSELGLAQVSPVGFGPTKALAAVAACMHMEVLIEYHGLQIHRGDDIKQALHERHCEAVFPTSVLCGDPDMPPSPFVAVLWSARDRMERKLKNCGGKNTKQPSIRRREYYRPSPATPTMRVGRRVDNDALSSAWIKQLPNKSICFTASLASGRRWRVIVQVCCEGVTKQGVGVASSPHLAHCLAAMHFMIPSTHVDFLINESLLTKDGCGGGNVEGNGVIPKVPREVLEHEGWTVVPPSAPLSCGNPYALTSTQDVDPFARHRIEHYFLRHGCDLRDHVTIKEESALCPHKMYRADVTFPVYESIVVENKLTLPMVGTGVGHTFSEAITLACMHVELLLGFYGVRIFENFISQRRHDQLSCLPGVRPPLPLRYDCFESVRWMKFVQAKFGRHSRAPHARRLQYPTGLFDVVTPITIDPRSITRVAQYLVQSSGATTPLRHQMNLFGVEYFVLEEGTVMARGSVPVWSRLQRTGGVGGGQERDCSIVAIGIGPDAHTARVLMCMHAERCLRTLNEPLFRGNEALQTAYDARARNPSFPHLRVPARMHPLVYSTSGILRL